MSSKLLLKRLPVTTEMWRKVGLFKHGSMHVPEYAEQVMQSHYDKVAQYLPKNFVSLEIGPGDSLSSAFVLNALGASKSYLIDVDPCAIKDTDTYLSLLTHLKNNGYEVNDTLINAESVDEMLSLMQCQYLVSGLESMKSIPDNSVDFIYSHAVFQLIYFDDVEPYVNEMHRVLSKNGVISHHIDLRDCITTGLNNLRFGNKFWETRWIKESGFYTNRLRYKEILSLFESKGFDVLSNVTTQWEELPLPKKSINEQFRERTDLLFNSVDLVLQK